MLAYTTPRFQIGASAENLLNVEWNQAQFATQTRLINTPKREPLEGVDELHFTPGTPFYAEAERECVFLSRTSTSENASGQRSTVYQH